MAEFLSAADKEKIGMFCEWVEQFGFSVNKLVERLPDPEQLERLIVALEQRASD